MRDDALWSALPSCNTLLSGCQFVAGGTASRHSHAAVLPVGGEDGSGLGFGNEN